MLSGGQVDQKRPGLVIFQAGQEMRQSKGGTARRRRQRQRRLRGATAADQIERDHSSCLHARRPLLAPSVWPGRFLNKMPWIKNSKTLVWTGFFFFFFKVCQHVFA